MSSKTIYLYAFAALNLFCLQPASAQVPSLDFVRQYGSTGQDDITAMTTDASGNLYFTGRYNGTVDFDPGAGVSNLTATGQADMYILKLDANANFVWARSMGSATRTDSGSGLAVDADGNVYAISSIGGTFDADPGPGVFNLVSAGTDNIGVIKLDASGNFVWAVRAGGNESDLPAAITLDPAGNIYIAGGFESSNVDFDPGPGTFIMSALALFDIFVWKLSPDGSFVWAKQASGFGSEIATDIVIDNAGNVVTTGDFQVTVDFDPGPGVFNMAPGGGADNAFVWKLTADGDLVWAQQMGGTSDDAGTALTVDGDDNIYFTGRFRGTADFDPGAGVENLVSRGVVDVFVSKLASDGSHLWSKSFGGTDGDYSQWIALDAARNIYLSGYFFGTTDLDPGPGDYAFAATGGNDMWLSKLDPDGNLLFGYTTGGTAGVLTLDAVLSSSGDLFVPLSFSGVVDADPGSGTTSITSAGASDAAVQKILQLPVPPPTITGFTPTSGMEGATVTISGTNFSSIIANNTVQFNGTTATVTISTLNAITVTVPAGATTGSISVTVGGQTAVSADDFTVIPKPVITFPTHPENTAVCPGAEATLTVSAGGTSNISYHWQKLDVNTSTFVDLANGAGHAGVTTTSLQLDLSAGATAGDYRVRVNGDFADEAYSDTATLSTLTPPAAPVAPSVSLDGSCGPIAVTLTATSAVAGEYRWYMNQNLNFFTLAETQGIFTTEPLGGSSVYYVSIFDGDCESEKTQVNVSVGYDGPGTRDASFNPPANGPGNISFPEYIVMQPDGKLLASNFEIGGVEYKLVRLTTDGSPDPSFTSWPETLFTGNANPIGLLPDGKIVLGGSFTDIDGNSLRRIARFNADGSLDLTFNSGSGFNGTVHHLAVQTDGKIIVTGGFTTYNGSSIGSIVRLNDDGTLDASFTPGTGPDSHPDAIAFQPDGKILIGGGFSSYNGTAIEGMARLNSDGTLDGSFTPPAGLYPSEIALQSDGKILAGGAFETVGGFQRNNIVRLLADGSVDTTFDPGAGADDWVYAIHQEASGKILIGGWFTSYDDTPRNFVARLNPDGTLDHFFDAGVGPYSMISNIIPFDNDRVYIGGYISHWNDLLHNGIALVNNECIREPFAEDVTTCSATTTLSACGGTDGQYRWYTTPSGGSAMAGETSATLELTNISGNTTYYVSLADGVCESARVPVAITFDASSVLAPVATGAGACSGNAVTLTASGSSDGNYRWYTTASGGTALAGEVNAQYTTPALTATTPYYVSIVDGSCESTRTEVEATIFQAPSAPTAEDIAACSGDPVTLSAEGFADGEFRWYDEAETLIAGEASGSLDVGQPTADATWYVSGVLNGCESARTEIHVTITECNDNTAPTIAATPLATQLGGQVTLDLSTIISDPDGNLNLNSVTIVAQPASGAPATISNGMLMIDYSAATFSGTDVLTIRACDDMGSCTDAEITVEVVGDVIVFNAVSPNGDGLNDFFRLQYIEVLEQTRQNRVTIYNRWGDAVFEIVDYDNAARVFKGLNKNGNLLPAGTYFYVVRFASGREEKSGYLALRY